ncbi:HET-E, partial [Dichomitus squalens LYAD-421 SS1]
TRTRPSHDGAVQALVASSDSKWIASAAHDGKIILWDVRQQIPTREWTASGKGQEFFSLAFSHDSRRLAAAGGGELAHCCLWDLASGRLRKVLQGHTAPVTTAALDPTGTRLATASMDHTVRIWDTEGGALITVLRGHLGPILDVAFSPDGKFVLSASEDKKAKIWPVSGGECTLSFKHFNWVHAARFSPDGRYVATTSWDHTVRLFKVEDGSLVRRLWEHEGAPVRHVVFSPDGETLWSGADDGSHCCLWDLASGRQRKVLQGHTAPVTTAALDPTGTRLATASMDHTVRIWDTEGGALITVLRGHSGPILDVAFSPDGKFVLSASEDKKAKIWPVSGGECTLSFKHFNWVHAARFSPDGRYVATTSWDHTVRLFKVEDGSLVRRLWEHEGAPVRHVVFSPDGETLWSGADDGSVSGRRLGNVLRA